MKTITQYLLSFSFFLMTLSFSLPSFAQGAPSIRKEAQGGGGHGPCIRNDGKDHTIKFVVAILEEYLPFLATCDLYVGYDFITSDMTYIPIPAVGFYQNPYNPEEYLQSFEILLTAAEIGAMCQQKSSTIYFDFFCLEYDVFISTSNGMGSNLGVNLCCDTQDKGSGTFSDPKNNIFIFDQKEESEYTEKMNNNQFSDYYIYDLHGNQHVVLKNKSTEISIQEHLSNLSIKTGIYLVRFWNGTKMETLKVFKN